MHHLADISRDKGYQAKDAEDFASFLAE